MNVDRSALGRVGGAVARKYGDSGFTGRLHLLLRGSAGQSFACFVVSGMDVKLVGEANDYVGKGMAGGDVTIVPPPGGSCRSEAAQHHCAAVLPRRASSVTLHVHDAFRACSSPPALVALGIVACLLACCGVTLH